jgi:pimeloyl-ACP methyl ester carboxylesterase
VGRQPELKVVYTREVDLAVWDWPGGDPPFVFAHATGFHGRCWDKIITMFPGRHCLAIDSRGHGRSGKPDPPYQWRSFGRDLVRVAEHFRVTGAIGIGHSMGGHITVQVAVARPETYAALVLVDPTIFPRSQYGGFIPDVSFTRRRRNQWTSVDEMYERFRDRMPFQRWRPGILRDYCDYGLTRNGEGYVLACPPEVEASIYENSKAPGADIHGEVALVRQAVTVMRAARMRDPEVFDLSASPTSPELASEFAFGREVVLPGATHYIAMEEPELVAGEIEMLASTFARTTPHGGPVRP